MFKCAKLLVMTLGFVFLASTASLAEVTVKGDIPAKAAEGAYSIATFVKDAADGKIHVIDVRTPEEYAAGHIAGSKNIDVKTIFEKEIPNLPTDKPIVLMCARGKRAAAAYAMVASKRPDIMKNVFFLDAAMEYPDGGKSAIIIPNQPKK